MAAAPDPDEVLRSTTGKTNFQRVARLLISGGTTLLREIFDQICSPSNLPAILKNPATEKQLKATKLTKPQWDCLYPSPGVYGKSADLDITLLFRLLRAICNLIPPATGWDTLPASIDHSLAADLARIKYYRNAVYGHVSQNMEITDDEFPQLWQEISDALIRLAAQISLAKKHEWQEAIDNFLKDPLTAEDERNIQELRAWYTNDMEVKKSIEELKVTTQEGMERMETSLKRAQSEVTKEVQEGLEESTHVLETAVREEAQDITKEVQDGLERLETRIQGSTHVLETAVREEAQDVTKEVQDGLERLETRIQGSTHVLETAVREEAQDVTKEVQDGLERLETRVQGSTHVLETAVREEAQEIRNQLGELHQSVDRLSSSDRNPQAAGAARLRLRIDCEAISGPGPLGGSSELVVAPQEPQAEIQLQAAATGGPLGGVSYQGALPSSQQVLDLAAFKYLKTIDPSKPEDLNGFVHFLREIRELLIVDTNSGSLIITVECSSLEILDKLWDDYCTGYLNEMAQTFLVTEELLKELGLVEVKLSTTILEEEYRACREYFLKYPVFDVKEEERLEGRRRRNSDSFLCFKPNEDDLTLMKLKHAEKKLKFESQKLQALEEENKKLKAEIAENKLKFENQRLQALEEENKKLKAEIAEAKNALRRLGWQEKVNAQETEKLERPGTSRRRHSDSDLYYKARDEEITGGKGVPEISVGDEARYVDSEKYAFVQSYLQNIRDETQSMTTETIDSGIRTHGAPSDIGMEDISDDIYTLRLKDLSREVVNELFIRLEVHPVARKGFNQLFGIKRRFEKLKSDDFVKIFPDTPVKLMKDAFEALQLYDLVDVLEKPMKSHRVRSLRRPLRRIENLSKTAEHLTTYHSIAGVLIIDACPVSRDTGGIDCFFKDLNSKSEVITIKCRKLGELIKLQFGSAVQLVDQIARLTLQVKIQKIALEIDKAERAASSVIDRWIHNQGNYSLFAVFVFSDHADRDIFLPFMPDTVPRMWTTLLEDVLGKLVTGLPDQVKFVVQEESSLMWTKDKLSETLMVTATTVDDRFLALMLEILNKRWQTLDLISMMEELDRSYQVKKHGNFLSFRGFRGHRDKVNIRDRLSSFPRFKKEDSIPITHST
ncbi:uncharacterized protein LOC144630676 isoform X1 [Oculina patagonica]